jgi:translin
MMILQDILDSFRREIDSDDKVREKALQLSREAVRRCSESIKMTHRGQMTEAENLVQQAHELIVEAAEEVSGSEFLSRSRLLDTAYQELAEAANLIALLDGGNFVTPEKYGIPSRCYLTGLADLIGELRRHTLDMLRENQVERGEQILKLMEAILDDLQSFDYPNALVPDLRRKCDVGRSLIERTRGDVTRAVGNERLIRELKDKK